MLCSVLAILFLCCHLVGAQTNTRTCVCGATLQGGNVNVRSCASTTCGVVGTIAAGDCYTWLSTSGVWRQISYPGQSVAWVHGDYVSGPQICGDGSSEACAYQGLCSSYSVNDRRTCDPQGCGNYGASRAGGTRIHAGTDIKCTMGNTVYAPFDGYIEREARPYGDGSCCDTGFVFHGSGTHANLEVKVFYARPLVHPNYPSGNYKKGEAVATHTGLHCGCYSTSMTDHIHFEIRHSGSGTAAIDPASWICLAPLAKEDELDDK